MYNADLGADTEEYFEHSSGKFHFMPAVEKISITHFYNITAIKRDIFKQCNYFTPVSIRTFFTIFFYFSVFSVVSSGVGFLS